MEALEYVYDLHHEIISKSLEQLGKRPPCSTWRKQSRKTMLLQLNF